MDFVEDEADSSLPTVSNRARKLINKTPLPYIEAVISSMANQWDAVERPGGDILLAVAENKLCAEILHDKVFSALQEDSVKSRKEVMNYTSSCGLPSFRSSLSRFLGQYVFNGHVPNPDHLIVGAGCVSGLVTLSLLLFDDHDSVLIPAPYYPAFDHDFMNFGHVHVQAIHGNPSDLRPFGQLSVDALQAAYSTALAGLRPPKAVLLSNPCNPLASLYSEEELLMVSNWCREKNLHLIMDEIYALSLFPNSNTTRKEKEFVSIVSLLQNVLGDHVHWLWSFSKDFGGSGLRAGVLYTQNRSLLKAASATNDAMMMSNLTQLAFQSIIDDDEFVKHYLRTNSERLFSSYSLLQSTLLSLNVHVLPAQGAIFAFADFSLYLDENSYEGERKLFDHFRKHGVILTPGESCRCPCPGYFRICYAFVQEEGLKEGLRRLATALEAIRSS